ncbi:glycosyltransferase [Vibrio sp. 1CM2L]|uniref:glycosyltransferase family 2 protein n=1 Tax=Vibrio sp. 1CM2L TaxID=2929166 RepID=UPI0020C16577|nr:glycosyltransferase [Vibrio sp. 1CM2L]MCK8078713.1 glycosyltransferase [Vibrio sp. 1CM2L]
MSISVVIPAYNSGEYIVEALESVIQHNKCDLEVIIVDDGSSDDTSTLVNAYAKKDKRVRYVYQENQGQSVARNIGKALASKDYLLFMDSDDTHVIGSLDRLYETVVTDHLDGLFFEAKNVDEMDGNFEIKFDYSRPTKKLDRIRSGRDLFVSFISENTLTVSPCLYLVRNQIVKTIDFFPGIHHEDNLFTFELLMSKKLKRCKVINDVLYNRRIRYGSIMTGKKTTKHVDGYKQVFLKVNEILETHHKGQFNEELLVCIHKFKARMLSRIPIALMESGNLYTRKGMKMRVFLLKNTIYSANYLSYKQLLSLFIPDINLVRNIY